MRVDRIDVPAETRAPTGEAAAYVLGESSGVLVDPATRTDELDDAVRNRSVDHLAVTHHHPDHVGAVRSYARAFDLTVWARAGRTDSFAAATAVQPDRTYGPAETITSGVRTLDTPGHTPEHTAFVTPAGAITGDLVVAEGSVVVAAPAGDMRAYLSSLRRIHAHDPARLFPAHGPTIDDPRATCERLLRHRLDRERRVRDAVHSGARTLAEILDGAYEKDLTGVRDLARATVRAHLAKLAVEGHLAWDGRRARPA